MTLLPPSPRHYPTAAAKCADLIVHITGLTFALFGGGLLLGRRRPDADRLLGKPLPVAAASAYYDAFGAGQGAPA